MSSETSDEIALGSPVFDAVSGFRGTVIAIKHYLDGSPTADVEVYSAGNERLIQSFELGRVALAGDIELGGYG